MLDDEMDDNVDFTLDSNEFEGTDIIDSSEDTDTENNDNENKDTKVKDKLNKGLERERKKYMSELNSDLFELFQEDEEDSDDDDDDDDDDDEDANEPSDNADTSKVFKVLANGLKSEGIIDVNDEEISKINSSKELFTAVKTTVESNINLYKDSLPPVIKHLINNWEEGVDLDELIPKTVERVKFESIDVNNLDESKAQNLLRYYFSLKGLSDTLINQNLDDVRNLGKSIERAKIILPELIEHSKKVEADHVENVKKEREQKIAKDKQYSDNLVNFINNLKDFNGIELNAKSKKAAIEALSVPIKENDRILTAFSKEREKNPSEFDAKVALLFTLTNGFTDFNVFTTNATRKVIKDVKDSQNRESSKAGGNVKLSPADELDAMLKSKNISVF